MARWAIDLLGRPYLEERFVPGELSKALKNINALRAPAVMLQKKDTLAEHDKIMRWVDKQLPESKKLFPTDAVNGPVVADFCNRCINKLAGEVEVFLFTFLTRTQYMQMITSGVPEEQRKKVGWTSFFTQYFDKNRIGANPASFKQSVRRIDKFLDDAEHLLDGGKNFLYCQRLTAAEIVFCSIFGQALCLDTYAGARLTMNEAPDAIVEEATRWKERPIGKFVAAIYRDCRRTRLI